MQHYGITAGKSGVVIGVDPAWFDSGKTLACPVEVAKHLLELFLGYLSPRVSLAQNANWLIRSELFAPALPS